MKKDRFNALCGKSRSGDSIYVSHPSTHEEGRVLSCSLEHFVVDSREGKRQCWDFHDCEEVN